ncbi:MAG: lysophospholipid acyltransferase family protein [Candidatus Omnitrophota bacterium]
MKIKTRRYYIYYLMRTLFFVLGLFPLNISLFISDFLGKCAYKFLPAFRKTALSNLNSHFSPDSVKNAAIAEKVFCNLIKNGAEWIKFSNCKPEQIAARVTEFHGKKYLDAVLSEGRGAIVMGFHFNNWELMPLYLRIKGYHGAVVARRIYFHKYDKLLCRMRRRLDVGIIYRDESPKKMLMELRKGNILGIVPDQDVKSVDGVFVDFFGESAYTPTAPVKLSMAAKTKILPAFMIRKKDNTHKLIIEEPIDTSEGARDENTVKHYTQLWSNVLEKYVREYPEQWVWVHPRWKTKQPVSL